MNTKNLKPAIAGLVIDNEISNNEIVATIVDLIHRGYIDYSKDKLILIKNINHLLKYEKKIVNDIFSNKKQIKSVKGKFIINSDSHYIKELVIFECIKNGYYQGLEVPGYKSNSFGNIIKLFLIIILLIGSCANPLLLIGVIPIGYHLYKTNKHNFKPTKTKVAKDKIKDYVQLYEYMKKHPLKKDRIFNEYLPFSIAFKQNNYWGRIFKIKQTEQKIENNEMDGHIQMGLGPRKGKNSCYLYPRSFIIGNNSYSIDRTKNSSLTIVNFIRTYKYKVMDGVKQIATLKIKGREDNTVKIEGKQYDLKYNLGYSFLVYNQTPVYLFKNLIFTDKEILYHIEYKKRKKLFTYGSYRFKQISKKLHIPKKDLYILYSAFLQNLEMNSQR